MIRMATPRDIPAIRALARECIVSGIMPTRSVTPEQVQAYLEESYADLETTLSQTRSFLILLEEDDKSKELIGYMMLDFDHVEPATGEKQCFIVDLAVRATKRGHFTTHRLMKKAAKLCRVRGMKYLVGTVSVNNARTLELAQKGLDFHIERVQIVKYC